MHWNRRADETCMRSEPAALEDIIDVADRGTKVAQFIDLLRREHRREIGVALENIGEILAGAPDLHRIALHEAVGVFAAHAALRQRQKDGLREMKTAGDFQV